MKKLITLLAVAFCLNARAQIITTFAGNGTIGYSGNGGQATAAELYQPSPGIFDAAGNLYFVDWGNNVVRQINTAGIISTIAGGFSSGNNTYTGDGGSATAAQLIEPGGIAFDASGNLYIADTYHSSIRMVNTSGIITTVVGNGTQVVSGDGGQASAAGLHLPNKVYFDYTGNMYIGDGARIRMVNTSGIITTIAGTGISGYSGDGGQASEAQLYNVGGITFDLSGNLYFTDYANNRIRMINTAGIITTIAGNGFGAPSGAGAGSGAYNGDGGQATAAELYWPSGLVFDVAGNLYFSDGGNNRIRKINTNGIISTIAGYGAGYYGDGGLASNAEVNDPAGLAFDIENNLYVGDILNNRIRKITPPLTINVNSANLCAGGSATLTATGATTYSWSPAIGLSASTGSMVVANPTVTTIYTIIGAKGDSMSITTSTVSVFTSVPTVSGTSTYTICGSGSKTLSVSGASTYTWLPSVTLSNADTASPVASPTTTTIYTVTGANGCGVSNPMTVTVNVNPIPTLSLTSNVYSMCSDSSQVISVSGASTYIWRPIYTVSNYTAASTVASPTSTTVYTVTGTTNGCTNVTPATVTVNVNPTPTVSVLGGAGNSQSVCSGSSSSAILFSANPPSYVSWVNSNTSIGLASSGYNNIPIFTVPTVTAPTIGIITINATSASSGCNSTSSTNITYTFTVNPIPSYSLAGDVYTVCYGGSQVLSASGASTYTWEPASLITGGNTSNPTTANLFSTTVYSLTGTSASRCTNITPATVTVNVAPQASVTLASNSYTICNGGSVGLSASGATNYQWSPPATLVNPNTASPIANPTAATVYTVSGQVPGCFPNVPATCTVVVNKATTATINPVGCDSVSVNATTYTATGVYTQNLTNSQGCDSVLTINATVNASPGPPVLVGTSNPFNLCAGTDTILTVTPANGCFPVWYQGTTHLYSYATYGLQDTTTGNSIYTVADSLINGGCVGSPLTLTVNIYAAPALGLSISSPDTAIIACIGIPDTIWATGSSFYTWTPSAGLNVDTGSVVIANPTVTTTYSVTGTIAGCNSSVMTLIILPVVSTPTVSFSLVQDPAPHTWDAYPNYSTNVETAIWYWGDGDSTVGLYPSHTYSVAGTYSICVLATDTGGCPAYYCLNDSLYRLANNSTLSNMININVLNGNQTTGLNALSNNNNEISIYPNPATTSMQISFSGNTANNTLVITDMLGNTVKQVSDINNQVSINVADLAEGVYNISLQSDAGTINKKIVILR